jgi:hypothetical protein
MLYRLPDWLGSVQIKTCLLTRLARFCTDKDVFVYLIGQAMTDYDGWLPDWPGSSHIMIFVYLICQAKDTEYSVCIYDFTRFNAD